MTEQEIRKEIDELLRSQLLAVLSTQREGQPYASLIAFASAADLSFVVFATPKATRKFANLSSEPRVSLLIDSRGNTAADFHAAAAVTIIGTAAEVEAEEKKICAALYLERHPYLEKFIQSPTTSLFKVAVRHYVLVNRFQHVMELHLAESMDLFS